MARLSHQRRRKPEICIGHDCLHALPGLGVDEFRIEPVDERMQVDERDLRPVVVLLRDLEAGLAAAQGNEGLELVEQALRCGSWTPAFAGVAAMGRRLYSSCEVGRNRI